jgi:adenylate kinase family enzyme
MKPLIAIHGQKFSGKGTIADYMTKKYGYEHVVISRILKDMSIIFFKEIIHVNDYNELTDGSLKEIILKNTNNKRPRDIMQWIGAEFASEVYPNMWIDIVMKQVSEKLKSGKKIYFDNLRLFPEFNAVYQRNDSSLWYIESLQHYSSGQNEVFLDYQEKNNYLDVLNDRKTIKSMIDFLFNEMADLSIIYKKEDFEKTLYNILKSGIENTLKKENNIHISEQGLDINKFNHIIYNHGTIQDLYNSIDIIMREQN